VLLDATTLTLKGIGGPVKPDLRKMYTRLGLSAYLFIADLCLEMREAGTGAHRATAEKAMKILLERYPGPGEVEDKIIKLVDDFSTAFQDHSWESMSSRGLDEDLQKRTYTMLINKHLVFTQGSILWAKWGFPVFYLTSDFSDAIIMTDLGEAADEPFKAPFPAFLIGLPNNRALNGAHSIFIHRWAAPLFFDGLDKGGKKMDQFRLWCSDSKVEGKEDLAQVYTTWNEKTTLKNLFEHTIKEGGVVSQTAWTDNDGLKDELLEDRVQRAYRIMNNTLLYIESHGLPNSGQKKIGPDVAVEREHATLPRFRIGRPVKLPPNLREALANPDEKMSWKLLRRFGVRGHWKNNQPYGPQHSLRKRIFIEPYWKGPKDMSEALERIYFVEKTPEDKPPEDKPT
jgi:hypothetical protein